MLTNGDDLRTKYYSKGFFGIQMTGHRVDSFSESIGVPVELVEMEISSYLIAYVQMIRGEFEKKRSKIDLQH